MTQGAAAAMFPFEDENDDLHWDEYGAALCPDEFQLKSTSRLGQLLVITCCVCIKAFKFLMLIHATFCLVKLTCTMIMSVCNYM